MGMLSVIRQMIVRSRLIVKALSDEELGLEVQKAVVSVVTVEAEANCKFRFMVGSVLDLWSVVCWLMIRGKCGEFVRLALDGESGIKGALKDLVVARREC